MRLRSLTVALVLVLGVDAWAMGALKARMPAPEPSSSAAPHASPAASPSSSPSPAPPAGAAVRRLLALAPVPDGWRAERGDGAVVSPSLDAACPSGSPIAPAFSAARSLRPASGSGGALFSVAAYPAGLGPAVLADVERRAGSCPGAYLSGGPQAGVQSVSVGDSGAVDGSGPSGRTVWFRVGDVVAVVSARGAGSWSVDAWASSWAKSWGSVVTARVCPDLRGSVRDAARNPLHSPYLGWRRGGERVALTAEQSMAARAAGTILASASGVRAGANPSLDERGPAPSPSPLPSYPAGLAVALPPSPSPAPSAPEFPARPQSRASVFYHSADPVGPGCGWAFTGMSAPPFDSTADDRRAAAEVAAGQSALTGSVARWWAARWEYARQWDEYRSAADGQSRWSARSADAIAAAWWADYDARLAEYQSLLAQWRAAHDAWAAQQGPCQQYGGPTPSPSPDPAATPPDCGEEPQPPVEPDAPTLPRP